MDSPVDFSQMKQRVDEISAGISSGKTGKNKVNYTEFNLNDETEVKKMFRDLTIINIGSNNNQDNSSPVIPVSNDAVKAITIPSIMSCSSCSTSFSSQSEQRAHFKSDWHRFNLKRRIKGESSITEKDFSTADKSNEPVDEENGTRKSRRPKPSGLPPHLSTERSSSCSSSSSSTDTDEEGTSSDIEEELESRKNPKVFFKNGENKILSLYRCVLHGRQNVPLHDGELIRAICTLHEKLKWTIIMVGGGHFAAAFFNGKDAVVHKTFHKYTVRGKQGTAQSSRDSRQAGSAPRSGGANLRRYNEANLIQDVQLLLDSWSTYLKQCSAIFYRAPGPNKTILFGGKVPPFKKGDDRLRTIPFATGRATFQEVQRIHQIFSTVLCFDSEENAQEFTHFTPRLNSPTRKSKKQRAKKPSQDLALQKSINKQAAPLQYSTPVGSETESDSYTLYENSEISDLTTLKQFENNVRSIKRAKKKKNKSPTAPNK